MSSSLFYIWPMTLLNNPIDQFLVLYYCPYSTNYMFTTFLSVTAILFIFWLLTYHGVFGKLEGTLTSLRGLASDAIISLQGYTSYLIFLCVLILGFNLFGMVPYTLTLTSFASTTFCLSLTSFVGLNLVALTLHNTKLVDLFLPSGAPLVMS